tara:strand:+ start:3057 stop:4073 length:1017 start_codon:yes stop_codon:yes gene_type:complete
MKRIVLYINPKSLNDATSHYIEIVNRAATELGFFFVITESINNIKFGDIIFTITTNNYIKGFFLRPFCKTIFWSQGIDPEESMMREKNIFKYYLKSLIEYIVLSLPSFKLFVSKAMLNHYKYKYNFNDKNYTTMPCYNLHYSEPLQKNLNRYKNPSFVYAGSLSIWQNIDETLQVYKCIENKIQNSTLTLLTEEIEKANNLLKEHNIKSAHVKYVDLEDLNNELQKYKYGFLLRRDNLVNNVATPTKMNSYLACGLIPIFTDAITDYKDQINLKDFSLGMSSDLSIDEIAKKIIDFESSKKDFSHLNIEIKKIFNEYYNDKRYIKEIKVGLKEYLSIK